MAVKASASYLFLLVVTLIANHENGASASDCLQITAAMTTGNSLVFFYGSRYISFDSRTRRESSHGYVQDYFKNLPDNFRIDAVFSPDDSPNTKILVSRYQYLTYTNAGEPISESPQLTTDMFRRGSAFAFGLDAGVTFRGLKFIFKGCSLLIMKGNSKLKIYNLVTMKLPCSIDAAWTARGRIVIAKGHLAWFMDTRRRLNRKPLCFANAFHTDLNICKCD